MEKIEMKEVEKMENKIDEESLSDSLSKHMIS